MKPEHDLTGRRLAGLSDAMVAMRGLLEAHDELARRQARRMGLGVTDMLALRLLDLHGPLGPSDLARRLDLRSASVTVLVDRLVAGGYVERRPDVRDRRRVVVHALPHALDRLFEIWAPVVTAMDALGHRLTAADADAVCTFFDGVAAVARGEHGAPQGRTPEGSTP